MNQDTKIVKTVFLLLRSLQLPPIHIYKKKSTALEISGRKKNSLEISGKKPDLETRLRNPNFPQALIDTDDIQFIFQSSTHIYWFH